MASVVDAVAEPEVPVMVSVAGPSAAVLLAVSISSELPIAGLATKDAVTPLGRPETLKLTLLLNP
jgi:hypothetical protein